MTRRADPERIYQAKRAGLLGRLSDRVPQDRAEARLADSEREAMALGLVRGSAEFWREVERLAVQSQ